jgi:WhiB family redox-sensing transcriptional regulator
MTVSLEDVIAIPRPWSPPPPWMEDARCQSTDPEVFFPGTGVHGSTDANKSCSICPVKAQCYAWAIENDEEWGIWGGVNMRSTQARAHRRAVRVRRYKDTGVVWISPSALTAGDGMGGYTAAAIRSIVAEAGKLAS